MPVPARLNPTFAGSQLVAHDLFTWKASGLCHKPLYFEDVQLERYGHSWNPVVQPFMSAAHFFVSVPLLPYKMGLQSARASACTRWATTGRAVVLLT